MRRQFTLISASLLLSFGIIQATCADGEPEILVVHEWGTFTELHDAEGISIGGINTDDEPVPDFVHRISNNVLQSTNEPWRALQHNQLFGKSVRRNFNVRNRLETPVIYFYPPAGRDKPMRIDVDVQLRGGWLSEYYPNATAHAPGIKRHELNPHAVGSLQWQGLEIGASGEIPQTDDHVWLAPRKTEAATVKTPEGEAERYLFYRGVGNFSGPLRVETDIEENQLRLISRFHTLNADAEITIPAAWLVHVKADGSLAFRSLGAMVASPHKAQQLQEISSEFEAEEFSEANRERLIDNMHQALVDDGLFDDEATAMLSTWRRAYFHTAGLRLFYLLPRQWTDDRMPLTLSVPAKVERVMVGRIELITDQQRELLTTLSQEKPAPKDWISKIPASPARDRFFAGDNDAATELGVAIPADYKAYLNLGRFRNALLHYELLRTRNANLTEFASTHGLVSRELWRRLQP